MGWVDPEGLKPRVRSNTDTNQGQGPIPTIDLLYTIVYIMSAFQVLLALLGGCKPNWDIGHFSWDIGILPLSNWDIHLSTSLPRFGILGFGSYEIGIWVLWNWDIWDTGTPPPLHTPIIFKYEKYCEAMRTSPGNYPGPYLRTPSIIAQCRWLQAQVPICGWLMCYTVRMLRLIA